MLHRLAGSAGIAITMAALIAAPALAGGVVGKTRYEYYTISGTSALDMVQSMLKKGPGYERGHAYALIEAKVKPVTKNSRGPGCKAADLTLNAQYTITLPRHEAPAALPSSVRKNYQRLSTILKSHEEKHRTIFNGCLKRMHQRIMALPAAKSCVVYSREVKKITKEEWARCDQINAALDKRDGNRHDTLPLIAQALNEAATARSQVAFRNTSSKRRSNSRSGNSITLTFDPVSGR